MSIENLPDDEKDFVNVIAKAGYLKAENDKIQISLESPDTISIQPKGTIFGAKIKVESVGSIAPTLTFDTKKLRDKPNLTPPEDILDKALEDFWDTNNV
jgi:hypothetical protein